MLKDTQYQFLAQVLWVCIPKPIQGAWDQDCFLTEQWRFSNTSQRSDRPWWSPLVISEINPETWRIQKRFSLLPSRTETYLYEDTTRMRTFNVSERRKCSNHRLWWRKTVSECQRRNRKGFGNIHTLHAKTFKIQIWRENVFFAKSYVIQGWRLVVSGTAAVSSVKHRSPLCMLVHVTWVP